MQVLGCFVSNITWRPISAKSSPVVIPTELTFRGSLLLFTVAYLWKSTASIYESDLKLWAVLEGLIFLTQTIHSLFHKKKRQKRPAGNQ